MELKAPQWLSESSPPEPEHDDHEPSPKGQILGSKPSESAEPMVNYLTGRTPAQERKPAAWNPNTKWQKQFEGRDMPLKWGTSQIDKFVQKYGKGKSIKTTPTSIDQSSRVIQLADIDPKEWKNIRKYKGNTDKGFMSFSAGKYKGKTVRAGISHIQGDAVDMTFTYDDGSKFEPDQNQRIEIAQFITGLGKDKNAGGQSMHSTYHGGHLHFESRNSASAISRRNNIKVLGKKYKQYQKYQADQTRKLLKPKRKHQKNPNLPDIAPYSD